MLTNLYNGVDNQYWRTEIPRRCVEQYKNKLHNIDAKIGYARKLHIFIYHILTSIISDMF
ncbi:hypothetical protein Avbf_10967 [Armadillidium vulgare]|nr:hypothetical protein Avbf_10967 [Armadillidium vulgare]